MEKGEVLNLEYVTKELLSKNWKDAARAQLLGYIKKFSLDTENGALTHKSKSSFKRFLYELFWAYIGGKLKTDQVVDLLKNETTLGITETQSILGDLLWFIGVETEDNKDTRKHLVILTKDLVANTLVTPNMLKERVEPDLLEAVGIDTAEKFTKRMIRVNTKSTFTQQKFNLLREEGEGFSKLLAELNYGDRVNEQTVDKVCRNVQSLIGYFNLDPNRVLDAVLDSYECNLQNDSYLKIIELFKREYLPHILGFKFQFYQQSPESETPKSLYRLAASLIKHKLISWEELYPHLRPDDAEAKIDFEEKVKEAKQFLPSTGVIMLSGSGDKEVEKEKPKKPEPVKPKEAENQKFGLVVGLLEMDAWPAANILLRKLGQLDPASYPAITQQLCQRLHTVIAPHYSKISMKTYFSTPPKEKDVMISPKKSKKETKEPFIPTDELLTQIFPILRHVHYHLYKDVILFTKACRLFKECLKQGSLEEEMKEEIEKVVGKVFLPALSMIPANPGMVNELWDLLKQFPYTTRYRLYGYWKAGAYNKYPELIKARVTALNDSKKAMRRLAKENVKPMGRVLGKIGHSHPIVTFGLIVEQIQQFDSLIQPVVDAMKYATQLSFDVLSYMILENLASPNKERLKSDGTNISTWLQNLAVFSGTLYRKYPATELAGILQYIVNQLKDNNSLDLLVLKELIGKMGGIEVIEDMSEAQLDAQAGGETLKLEAYFTAVRNLKRPTQKLRDSLINSKLALPLLILIAQQRSNILFNTESNHLKLIGDLFDKCQETLIQYVEFLTTHVTDQNYANLLPSILDLVRKYHLEPETAFYVSRTVLPIKYDDLTCIPRKLKELKEDGLTPMDVEEKKEENQDTNSRSLVHSVGLLFPSSTWTCLSPQLYVTFWSLSLYDIYVPRERYEEEIKKLQAQIQTLEDEDSSKKKKEKDRIQATVEKLRQELAQQEKNHQLVMERVMKEKDTWLASCPSYNEIVMQLLQNCILPRCVYTAEDAIYCAKFVQLLNSVGTPYFSTLQYYDKALKDITLSLFCCTENEASRLGRFLHETLSLLSHWKSDENVYNRECVAMPGFSKSFVNSESEKVIYSEFVKVNFKWHCNMARSFVACLNSKEYMEIRNALVVLTKLVKVFPVLKRACVLIEKRVAKIKEDERADLKVLAARYHALLEMQKKNTKTDDEFHGIETKAKEKDKDFEGKLKEEGKLRDSDPKPRELVVKDRDSAEASKKVKTDEEREMKLEKQEAREARHREDNHSSEPRPKESKIIERPLVKKERTPEQTEEDGERASKRVRKSGPEKMETREKESRDTREKGEKLEIREKEGKEMREKREGETKSSRASPHRSAAPEISSTDMKEATMEPIVKEPKDEKKREVRRTREPQTKDLIPHTKRRRMEKPEDVGVHKEEDQQETEKELKEREKEVRDKLLREKERLREREAKEKLDRPEEVRKDSREQESKERKLLREMKEPKEREIKERDLREREPKENSRESPRESKEREMKERELLRAEVRERDREREKERELKEAKEREAKERELKEAREREAKEREAREREAREREAKEREAKDRDPKDRELKEKDKDPRENRESKERETKDIKPKEEDKEELGVKAAKAGSRMIRLLRKPSPAPTEPDKFQLKQQLKEAPARKETPRAQAREASPPREDKTASITRNRGQREPARPVEREQPQRGGRTTGDRRRRT